MEFGRIPRGADVHLSLPESPPRAPFVGRGATFALRFGLPVFARDEFVGPLYPEGTRKSDYLAAYGERCTALELNATFYSVPTVARTAAWASAVPSSFRFCPKMPKGVSHARSANRAMLDAFVASLEGFGDRLGPTFIQLPEWADTSFRRPLFDLVEALPSHLHFALELRNERWFEERETFAKLSSYLEKKRVGLVITDTPGRRDALHMRLTAPFTVIRFLGHDAGATDRARIDEWLGRIDEWRALALEEAYFFIHYADEVDGIPLLEQLKEGTSAIHTIDAPPRDHAPSTWRETPP